jgi:hypothetical protein
VPDPDPILEEACKLAYVAFCESAKEFLPAIVPEWHALPEPGRRAWAAAVKASSSLLISKLRESVDPNATQS